MITKQYIDMCSKAKEIQLTFHDVNLGGIAIDFLPAFVFLNDKKIVGNLLLPPSTIKIKGKHKGKQFAFIPINPNIQLRSDKVNLTQENIVWLPTIEQMIHMYKKFVMHHDKAILNFSDVIIINEVTEFYNEIIAENEKDSDLILYLTRLNMNQIFLMFIMVRMYNIAWNINKLQWDHLVNIALENFEGKLN